MDIIEYLERLKDCAICIDKGVTEVWTQSTSFECGELLSSNPDTLTALAEATEKLEEE